ncbi:MAG: hypothetical protein KA319_09780 [Ferruginibacter sp.]|nr:hypothetical protein [Ferruginibacter sp.]
MQYSILLLLCFFSLPSFAQVNSVEFGKNRVQYKKFKWQYYQTQNFNVYFNEGGKELAQFVAQIAEEELPKIETTTEYTLQRRANIILYNQYSDMQQSNIGLGFDWQNTTGVAKLVNNKMIVYFDANHANLKKQVRGGIAQIIVDNKLFGDDIAEIAGNQTLLDLPKWFTNGYVSYVAERWSTEKDDELKSEMLSGNYKNFHSFAFAKPEIAGHAFWYYIDELYKKENTTYFLYLATQYKNINKACQQICKKKFKEVLSDFMEYQEEKYYQDLAKRKPYPKGNYVDGFDINKRLNYFRFNVNPNKKNNSYVVTQFRKGIVRVIYNDEDVNKTLVKFGSRTYQNEMNPNYPMMAWDNKGTRIAVAYVQEGLLKFFVYDIVTRVKSVKIDLTKTFDQIQDMKYAADGRKMLISGVKNGKTDIYILDTKTEKVEQITNDVYDDLDATFVAFPNKSGIIFSSNRPNPNAKSDSTTLPSDNKYNVFLITNFGDKPELNQITQLTNLKYGNARFPMQYNVNHFTFVSDENGIGNRYAGFFTTKAEGLDTLVLIGNDILRNPTAKDVDSTLRVYKKTDVDSIAVVAVSSDSTYTFPLTNYESTLGETRIAGDNNQVSEVTRQSDEKILYKLKINEDVLRRRNITARPTTYMKRIMDEYKSANAELKADELNTPSSATDTTKKVDDFFQTEFANEKVDSNTSMLGKVFDAIESPSKDVLKKAKLFVYKPGKWGTDAASATLNTNVLINRYQPYAGGGGPIMLNSGSPLNGLVRMGATELLEDYRVSGAFKIGTNLKDNEWLISFQNLRKRLDWGLTYYRNVQRTGATVVGLPDNIVFGAKQFTNLYQGNIAYPFDNNKSIRFTTGIRSDNLIATTEIPIDVTSGLPQTTYTPATLFLKDNRTVYSTTKLEFVYDNSQNPAMNIWHGLRYKIYFDWNAQINKQVTTDGPNTFNLGFDARYYYPIFRNFIWAGRAAGDFSWGNQKMIYYLGGVDGWLMFGNNTKLNNAGTAIEKYRYFNPNNRPATDQSYAFQSLATNMRGFVQNVANGNNVVVLNSEFRLPVLPTLFNKTFTNKFLNSFQLVQFIDLGTAWNGAYNKIQRPTLRETDGTTTVITKAGGVGPFAGGYGFGARGFLAGYFIKFDAAWQMRGIFKGKPQLYVALGLDF